MGDMARSLADHDGPKQTDVGWNDPPPVAFQTATSTSINTVPSTSSPLDPRRHRQLAKQSGAQYWEGGGGGPPVGVGGAAPPVGVGGPPRGAEGPGEGEKGPGGGREAGKEMGSGGGVKEEEESVEERDAAIKKQIMGLMERTSMNAGAQAQVQKRIEALYGKLDEHSLSEGVGSGMRGLGKAVEEGDFTRANEIHVSLMHTHFDEVSFWMTGLKKLIALNKK